MSFSLVFSPYNIPPFAPKQAQWSKLENVMPLKNELNASVYFPRSSFSDFLFDSQPNLVSLLTFSNLTEEQPGSDSHETKTSALESSTNICGLVRTRRHIQNGKRYHS